jgi:hypothetical protein
VTNYALRLSAKSPLEWTDAHEHVLRCSDALWDDLRAIWIQCLHEQSVMEEATGDADLLRVRRAISRAQANVDAAFAARRAWRQRERCGGSTPAMKQAIAEAIRARRAALSEAKPVEKRIRTEIRADLLALYRERDEQMRRIAQGRGRKYADLHDGQYNDILKRFLLAAHRAAKQGRFPRLAREHPSRSLYVQLKAKSLGGTMEVQYREDGSAKSKRKNVGGALVGHTWEGLLARKSGVRFEPRRERADGPELLLTLPVDSHGLVVRVPVYAEQRPPAGALLKGVRLVRTESAEQWRPRWHVVVSVQADSHLRPIERGVGTLYCGLNWRQTVYGLRVLDGVWSETGERWQVHLPPELVARGEWGDHLQAALDRRANAAAQEIDKGAAQAIAARDRRGLRALAHASGQSTLVAWAEGTARGHDLHVALLAARKRYPYDPEKQADAAAEAMGDRVGRWRLEHHRRRTLHQRNEAYRQVARWIMSRCARVVIGEQDGQRLARLLDPLTGRETTLPLPARRARQYAAPSELAGAMRWAAERAGVEWVSASTAHASHTCVVCDEEMIRVESDRAALMLRCSVHGLWDRDHGLALALWRDDLSATDRERWLWHADPGRRSQVKIVRVDEEIRRKLRGRGQPWARLRYETGMALADRDET